MCEAAVVAILEADEYVGPRLRDANGHYRIAPISMPQHWRLPALIYDAGEDERFPKLVGVCETVRRPMPITAVHYSYEQVRQLAAHVRMALDDKSGVFAGTTILRIGIDPDQGGSMEDIYYPGPSGGSDDRAFLCTQVFDVWFNEEIA